MAAVKIKARVGFESKTETVVWPGYKSEVSAVT